ncbi:MAG: hypothetical protein AAF310_00140 [Myxococcota bacterium]
MNDALFVHRKQIFVVAAIVAIVVLGYGARVSWQWRQDAKVSDVYLTALSEFNQLDQGSGAQSDDKRKQEQDKTKELEAALGAFEKVHVQCPSCRADGLAALNEGQLSMRLGKYEQALQRYRAFMQDCSKHEQLCAWAVLGQARAQEALGKQQEALAVLEQTKDDWQHTAAASFVQWYLVRLSYQLGQRDKLQNYAQQLQQRFPNMWMTQQAKQLVQQPAQGEDVATK